MTKKYKKYKKKYKKNYKKKYNKTMYKTNTMWRAIERKAKDFVVADAAVSSSGTITLINGMVKGDTISTREARKINQYLFYYKAFAAVNQTTAEDTIVRLMIFVDTQHNGGSDPAVTDVLRAATPISLLNFDNRFRFKVLSDKLVTLSVAGPNILKWKKYIKIPKSCQNVIYDDGNVGDATDIIKNALYMLVVSDATNEPELRVDGRLRYTDN